MKVAMPIWEGRISPVLDTARCLEVAEVEDGQVVGRTELPLNHDSLFQRAAQISGYGITVLICGGVSRPLANMLNASRVKVIPWIKGGHDEVLEAYITENLTSIKYTMPGCRGCGRGRKHHGRGNQGRKKGNE
jgi:predicted Fe-Mo cluster-binding NifX family protein